MPVFDTGVLLLLFDPDAGAPIDPATGAPLVGARERLDSFVSAFARLGGVIVVPTPVVAEILVKAGDAGPRYLEILQRSAHFQIADFDLPAAVEAATMTEEALDLGDKKRGVEAPWQKIKTDRQILAIARTRGETVILSDDETLRKQALGLGFDVIRSWELVPPKAAGQGQLDV